MIEHLFRFRSDEEAPRQAAQAAPPHLHRPVGLCMLTPTKGFEHFRARVAHLSALVLYEGGGTEEAAVSSVLQGMRVRPHRARE